MASNISYNSYYGYYGINWASASSNNNIIYSGKSSDGHTYRSRIILNTSDMIISSSSKLVVKITVAQQGSQYYDHTVARLSTHDLANPGDYYQGDGITPITDITKNEISNSKFYTDSAGTSLVGSVVQAKGNVLYLVFDTKNKIEANKKYYIYIGREGTTSSRFNAFQASEIKLTYESYTACSAPTSVSASGIITPNGEFTVTWSGAKAGTGNSIKGYDIYYRITSSGSAPTISTYTGKVSVSSTSTSGSKKIEVDGATRGYKVVCGIITKGEAGSSYYSNMKTGGSVLINRLPSEPTLSGSKGIIKSTATVSITATAGSDNDEQTYKVYYNTSNSHDGEQKYSSSSNLDIDEGTSVTYYFWTKDGLEYSSVVSRTVTKNSKPSVSIKTSGTFIESINALEGKDAPQYVISPTITLTKGSDGQSSNNKYTYRVYYGKEKEDLSVDTYTNQPYIILEESITKTSITVEDIRDKLKGKIDPPYYYKLSAIRNDGIENSKEVISDTYYITEVPKVTAVSNKKKNSVGIDPKTYFSKEIYIEAERDEGYTHIKFNGISSKFTNSGDKMYTTCDVTGLNHGQSYKFIFTLYNSSYTPSATQTWSTTLTKILYFQEDLNLEWANMVNPFEKIEEVKPSFRNIFGTTELNETVYYKYGFSEAPTYKLTAKYGDKNKTLDFTQTHNTPDNVSISLSGNQVYELFDSLFPGEDKNKNTTYNVKVTLSTANVFGDVVQGTINKEVKYYGIVPKLEINVLEFWNENNDAQLKTEYFKQSMFPKITLECESYYGKPSEIRLIGKNGETVFYDKNKTDVTWTVQGTLSNGSPETYETTLIFPSIGVQLEDLKDPEGTKFICSVSLSNLLEVNKTEEFSDSPVGRHTEGTIVVNNATYNSNALSLSYSISDFGLSIDDKAPITNKWYTNQLQYKVPGEEEWRNSVYFSNDMESIETSDILNTQFSTDPFNFNFNTEIFKIDNDKEYDYITIRLYLTVRSQCNPVDEKLDSKGWTTKYAFSNEFIIYNLKPTVAYRKNRLGINHDFSDANKYADGILVINSHSGVHTIYLVDGDKTRTIDLLDGALSNFKIDGGTWG